MKGGRHRKTYVTRMAGEELDPTCLIEKIQCKKGWMFWGSINGAVRGPSLFWEKKWENINKDSYQERIVPLIHGWICMNPGLVLMQDNAPGHAAKDTQDELHSCGIVPIQWPPYSPDLNPIETIWNIMKDWIAEHYGSENHPTYDQLQVIVQEVWEQAFDEDKIQGLVEEMQTCCDAVIAANGTYIPF